MVNRVVIREDMTFGQKIKNFKVEFKSNGQWKTLKEGQSIGNRRIILFSSNTEVNAFRINVDCGLTTVYFEARNCENISKNEFSLKRFFNKINNFKKEF